MRETGLLLCGLPEQVPDAHTAGPTSRRRLQGQGPRHLGPLPEGSRRGRCLEKTRNRLHTSELAAGPLPAGQASPRTQPECPSLVRAMLCPRLLGRHPRARRTLVFKRRKHPPVRPVACSTWDPWEPMAFPPCLDTLPPRRWDSPSSPADDPRLCSDDEDGRQTACACHPDGVPSGTDCARPWGTSTRGSRPLGPMMAADGPHRPPQSSPRW